MSPYSVRGRFYLNFPQFAHFNLILECKFFAKKRENQLQVVQLFAIIIRYNAKGLRNKYNSLNLLKYGEPSAVKAALLSKNERYGDNYEEKV